MIFLFAVVLVVSCALMIGRKTRKVTLRAGDNMTLDGAINAEKLSVR
jgi:hypothetical protein